MKIYSASPETFNKLGPGICDLLRAGIYTKCVIPAQPLVGGRTNQTYGKLSYPLIFAVFYYYLWELSDKIDLKPIEIISHHIL